MSVITSETYTYPTGLEELCGNKFAVIENKRVGSVFVLQNTSVEAAITLLANNSAALTFRPAVQVPVSMCEGLSRFCFEHDDPMMIELGDTGTDLLSSRHCPKTTGEPSPRHPHVIRFACRGQ